MIPTETPVPMGQTTRLRDYGTTGPQARAEFEDVDCLAHLDQQGRDKERTAGLVTLCLVEASTIIGLLLLLLIKHL